MKNTTHPIDELELMAYLDGELPRERAAAAAVHLEDCRECQTIAKDLRNVSQELASWQIAPSDSEITPELLAALDEHVRKQESVAKKHRPDLWLGLHWSRILGWSSAGIGVVLLLIAVSTPNLMRNKQMAELSATAAREPQRQQAPSGSINDYYGNQARPNASPDVSTAFSYDSQVSNGLLPLVTQRTDQGAIDQLHRNATQSKESKQGSRELAIPTGPMIIRTAELTLTATNFEQVRNKLEDILKRYNGYLGQLSVTGSAESAQSLTATLRVPADKLDSAIAELKKLGRVESESQKGDEVSQQYIDLQARLGNARNTEQTLLDILRHRTGKLADVLAVEQEIASVREEIERMQAEKKSLEKQVAFSTVELKVAEDYKQPVHVVPTSTSRRIRDAAVDGYETLVAGLINVLLFFVSWGPSLLVWGAILFFPVRMLWKRWRQRNVI